METEYIPLETKEGVATETPLEHSMVAGAVLRVGNKDLIDEEDWEVRLQYEKKLAEKGVILKEMTLADGKVVVMVDCSFDMLGEEADFAKLALPAITYEVSWRGFTAG